MAAKKSKNKQVLTRKAMKSVKGGSVPAGTAAKKNVDKTDAYIKS